MCVLSQSSEFDIFATKSVRRLLSRWPRWQAYSNCWSERCRICDTCRQWRVHRPRYENYIRGNLTNAEGRALDNTDFTAVKNIFLLSLFNQCSIALKELTVTQVGDLYNYCSFFLTILMYGCDATASILQTPSGTLIIATYCYATLPLPMLRTRV